jgi:hypothetical protein
VTVNRGEDSSLGRLLGVSLGVEVVALAVCVLLAGGGHGSYFVAKLLFPYTMALTYSTDTISSVGMMLALGQYPAYAAGVWSARHGSLRERRWMILGLIHAAAAAAAFVFADSSFTP